MATNMGDYVTFKVYFVDWGQSLNFWENGTLVIIYIIICYKNMRNSWLFQLNLSVEILFLLSTGVLPSCELIKGKIIFFFEIYLYFHACIT